MWHEIASKCASACSLENCLYAGTNLLSEKHLSTVKRALTISHWGVLHFCLRSLVRGDHHKERVFQRLERKSGFTESANFIAFMRTNLKELAQNELSSLITISGGEKRPVLRTSGE